jgi:hypothetical protein
MENDNMTFTSKIIIGRLERVDIPKWDLYGLEAKIDTGAYTSSFHCHHIQVINGNYMVEFKLLDPSHEDYNRRALKMPIYDTKKVKSSNGISEDRIIVKATIVLASVEIETRLSLTDRSEMRYPLLIGRSSLKRRFLVDVDRKYKS